MSVAVVIPNRRLEEWKYSDLRAVIGAADLAALGAAAWRVEDAADGVTLFDLAKDIAPEWVTRHLGKVAATGPMESAARTFARNGAAIRVAGAPAPIRLMVSGAGHARFLIVLDDCAELTLIETQATDGDLRNVAMEVVLGANAQLTHIRFAPHAPEAVQVETIGGTLAHAARYRAHYANFGARLSRTELHLTLAGEGAQADLSGVSVLAGAHADITTHITHAVGQTQSTQLFKKVAAGHARGVYQGKITVAESANGSDSRQTAKAILLGGRAEADLKPELEILADDVKCAHGAAVGDLDAESLFYLRSRGVPEAEARNLLIRAFLEDAVSGIADEALRAELWRSVEAALPQILEAA